MESVLLSDITLQLLDQIDSLDDSAIQSELKLASSALFDSNTKEEGLFIL